MNKSKLINSKILLKSFFNVRQDDLEIDGKEFHYVSIETAGDAVLILPITTEGKYVLTLEYRYPIKETLLSVSGGYIDGNEDIVAAAKRELLEETGYTAENFTLKGSAYPYPGISSQKLYYVTADHARKIQKTEHEISEQIETIELSPKELKEKVNSGFPVDGNLFTALFFL